MIEVPFIDRLIASTSAMAGALYVLAALALWFVLLRKWFGKAGPDVRQSVLIDRAVAWSALAILFLAIAVAKIKWVEWRELGEVFIAATLAIMLAGLCSVREITREKFGNLALMVFVAVVLTAGLSVWLWG